MASKGFNYAKKFAGMTSALTIFICCSCIFVRARGDINLNTLLYALWVVIPAALVVGTMGHLIGSIFDSSKKKRKLNKFIK